MSRLITTPLSTTRRIDQNPVLAALAFPFEDGYEAWSETTLSYTVNRDDANPDGTDVAPWNPDLEIAVERALADISAVSGLRFVEVSDQVNGPDGADIDLWYYADPSVELYGYSYGPEGAGVFINEAAIFRVEDGRGAGLTYGGINYEAVIHELLHNLGFAHPHPDVNAPRGLPGVTQEFDDTGDFALNQTVFSLLSYNSNDQVDASGAPTTGQGFAAGAPVDRGYSVLGTFDIALLQALYGENRSTASGDDIYDLSNTDATGTHFKAIWDSGGTDEFRHTGTKSAVIDLRAATLDLADGALAGGGITRVESVFGGYTIAQGTVIENATGGAGDDRLIGNPSANTLNGGAGHDTLEGGGGADTLMGGDGDDLIIGFTLAEAIADGFDFDDLTPVIIDLPDLPDPDVVRDPDVVAFQNAARTLWWEEQIADMSDSFLLVDFV
jgi:serralysin